MAKSNERLRQAIMVPVWQGEAPKFPISKKDALGRLQARLFCEIHGSLSDHPSKRLAGLEWQSFPDSMPILEEATVEVESRLLWPSENYDPE